MCHSKHTKAKNRLGGRKPSWNVPSMLLIVLYLDTLGSCAGPRISVCGTVPWTFATETVVVRAAATASPRNRLAGQSLKPHPDLRKQDVPI